MKKQDWECPFRVVGLGVRSVQYGYGVDSMQALATALEGIRVTLEKSGTRFTWIGSSEPGDAGFERLVTTSFGVRFTQRLNRLIDKEIKSLVEGLKRRHLRRLGRAKDQKARG
jgi:hypothetical protein